MVPGGVDPSCWRSAGRPRCASACHVFWGCGKGFCALVGRAGATRCKRRIRKRCATATSFKAARHQALEAEGAHAGWTTKPVTTRGAVSREPLFRHLVTVGQSAGAAGVSGRVEHQLERLFRHAKSSVRMSPFCWVLTLYS